MKSLIVMLLLAIAICAAFWFVWMNRASEKVVTGTVPIAVAALLGIFLVGWVFGGGEDYEAVFPVSFMLDLRTKLPIEEPSIISAHRFSFGPSPVPRLKQRRPDLFADTDKNDLARNVYHHLLQRSIVDFLAMLYRGSWKAEVLYFDIGAVGFGRYGPATGSEHSASRILGAKDIEQILRGNWFADIHRWPNPQISLPPGSRLDVTPPTGDRDSNSNISNVRITNQFCSISFSIETALPMRTIGEYRLMADLSDDAVTDFATNVYIVRTRVHYSRLRFGHPQMKTYKHWAAQLVDEFRNQHDEQIIWNRVKEQDMRTRHYGPGFRANRHSSLPLSATKERATQHIDSDRK